MLEPLDKMRRDNDLVKMFPFYLCGEDDLPALNGSAQDPTVVSRADNGVDLEKYPLSMGPLLTFDPEREVFTNNDTANEWLSREYRPGFECPKASEV